MVRGTAQNPDVFFQAREAGNPFHDAVPGIVAEVFAELAARTGRRYGLVDYEGPPDAERVIVMMGSGAGAVGETVAKLVADGEKVGLATIRLFRPFPTDALLEALPDSVRSIAVLDRTKEPGSAGEPLFQDVITAVAESERTGVRIIGGRYGLGSKEFTPAMAKAVFDELTLGRTEAPVHRRHRRRRHRAQPRRRRLVPRRTARAVGGVLRARQRRHRRGEQGVGEDHRRRARPPRPGLLRLRLEEVRLDDRLAPALRPRTDPLDVPVQEADLVACHQFGLLDRFDVLGDVRHGGTFLLNAPYPADELWEHLPTAIQRRIHDRELRVFTIDATRIARELKMPGGSTRSCSRASSR